MYFLISLLFFAVAPQARPEGPAISPSGTYDILICKGSCRFNSSENVLVRGLLVLEAQSFQPPDLPAVPDLNRGPRDLFLRRAGATNACFVLETLERNRTYAGLIPVGFTQWWSEANTVSVELYASPDAGHNVTVTLTAEGFQGTGSSRGAGGGAPPNWWQPDVVVGRRAGPSNRSICASAYEKAAQP